MSDWTDAGLPTPLTARAGYGYSLDLGIRRSQVPMQVPNQDAWYKAPQKTFAVSFITNDLASLQTYLAATGYGWHTVPLDSGTGLVADHTVRIIGRVTRAALGNGWFEVRIPFEERITIAAADVSDHGYSTTDTNCCFGADGCATVVFFESDVNDNDNWTFLGEKSVARGWTDSFRVAVGVYFGESETWGWGPENIWRQETPETYPAYAEAALVSQLSIRTSTALFTSNAEGLVAGWYGIPVADDNTPTIVTAEYNGVEQSVFLLLIGGINSTGTLAVQAKCPACPAGSTIAYGELTVS